MTAHLAAHADGLFEADGQTRSLRHHDVQVAFVALFIGNRNHLDAEGFRDVPPEFNLFAENGIPKQEGRRATFDFKKLYRDDPAATGGVPDLKISDGDAARTR